MAPDNKIGTWKAEGQPTLIVTEHYESATGRVGPWVVWRLEVDPPEKASTRTLLWYFEDLIAFARYERVDTLNFRGEDNG